MTVQLWAPGRWQVSTWKEDIVSTGLEDWAQDIRSVEKKNSQFLSSISGPRVAVESQAVNP